MQNHPPGSFVSPGNSQDNRLNGPNFPILRGFSEVPGLPEGEQIVSMVEFEGRLIVAATHGVYVMFENRLYPMCFTTPQVVS